MVRLNGHSWIGLLWVDENPLQLGSVWVAGSEIDRRLQVEICYQDMEALSTLLATNVSLANALSKWRVMLMSHEKKHDFTSLWSVLIDVYCLVDICDFPTSFSRKFAPKISWLHLIWWLTGKKLAIWRQFQLDTPSIYSFHSRESAWIPHPSCNPFLKVPSLRSYITLYSFWFLLVFGCFWLVRAKMEDRVPNRMGFSPVMWVVPFIFFWNQCLWDGKFVPWSNPCLKQRDSGLVPLGIHPQCQDPSSWWSSKEHYHAVRCPSCLKNTETQLLGFLDLSDGWNIRVMKEDPRQPIQLLEGWRLVAVCQSHSTSRGGCPENLNCWL